MVESLCRRSILVLNYSVCFPKSSKQLNNNNTHKDQDFQSL